MLKKSNLAALATPLLLGIAYKTYLAISTIYHLIWMKPTLFSQLEY